MTLQKATSRETKPGPSAPARSVQAVRAEADAPACEPERWLNEHGDALYRFALLHLGRGDRAEDAVQETLLAAIRAPKRVEAADSVRAWLLGILRHKVADQFRLDTRRRREVTEQDDGRIECSGPGPDDPLLPAGAAESAELRKALETCIQRLPEQARAAFCLRNISGLGTLEICEILDVNPNHLGVLVHRAKTQLRAWLTEEWHASDPGVRADREGDE